MPVSEPTRAQIRRWRRHLADERAEAVVYRDLAQRCEGEEREILQALADAEGRHEKHWLALLGDRVGRPRSTLRSRALGAAARRFGWVFVLALAQRAETRGAASTDADVTLQMVADEAVHAEVVRGLAARGRQRMSGSFRAAVFGANDGLVSNLALVLGIGATGVASGTVLVTGVAGLLAGALSMAAGEYVSVSSQRELLAARRPTMGTTDSLRALDAEANELALVYRAQGMDPQVAAARARILLEVAAHHDPGWSDDPQYEHGEGPSLADLPGGRLGTVGDDDEHEAVGTAWGAASSSFVFFASGAVVPVVPYLLGASGLAAVAWSAGLVGLALVTTGGVVGLLSGSSPVWRALRQLAIGWGAAAATYLLGFLFNVSGI
ncbi:MAG: VIT1/CCC1 transporter family protein [Micrococcales bacterium]|nr:VIT1/CCC1 transporter family protein [Micrococcales bacterium]